MIGDALRFIYGSSIFVATPDSGSYRSTNYYNMVFLKIKRSFSTWSQACMALAIGCLILLGACSEPGEKTATQGNVSGSESTSAAGDYSIEARFQQCGMDSLRVYILEGGTYKAIAAAPFVQDNGTAVATLNTGLPVQGFYMIGQAPNNLTSLILGQEKGVQLSGNCNDFGRGVQTTNSPINAQLQAVSQQYTLLQQESQNAMNMLRVPTNDPRSQQAARQQMQDIFAKQLALQDSVAKLNPFLGKVLALNLYQPFDQNNNTKNYPGEIAYYGNEYMAFAQLNDPDYDYIPLVNFHISNFVRNLFGGGAIPKEDAIAYVDKLLGRFADNSLAQKNAYATVLQSLDQVRSTAYLNFGQAYQQKFPKDQQTNAAIQNRLQVYRAEAEAEKSLGIGAIPPEINLPTPDGPKLKLSSLRGKVVLLDFWAAWCRPCRMENPNVVRLYNKYKDKGFDVYGVSLDRSRADWLKAIQDDKMTWNHVSEIKHWDSEAARAYRVSGIPATWLLDRDGKIIGKNLRGRALEQKLDEIFAKSL